MKMAVRNRLKAFTLAVLACLAGLCPSCDGLIYDEEGDCSYHYYVRFKYDYNMLSSDAFQSQVKAVTLYLLDADGRVVWQKTESGSRLADPQYRMEVDVNPGTYDLMAWAKGAEETDHYTVGNEGTRESLTVRFASQLGSDGRRHIASNLTSLFHGYLSQVTLPQIEGDSHTVTLPLQNDVNHLTVVVHQEGGEPIDKDEVRFEITDDNSLMGWNNLPLAGNPVVYDHWHAENTELHDLDLNPGRAAEVSTGVKAELATSRLMADGTTRPILRGYWANGTKMLEVPLVDVLLLFKSERYRQMGNQEFLDRMDDYNLAFFIDRTQPWMSGVLYIESWRVVYSLVNMGE